MSGEMTKGRNYISAIHLWFNSSIESQIYPFTYHLAIVGLFRNAAILDVNSDITILVEARKHLELF